MSEVPAKLASFIATRDKRIAKDQPWSPMPLAQTFRELLAKGAVKVGGRATCGTKTDPTWKIYRLWGEVVRKARTMGYVITESDIKHGNGWATKAGGFWDETEYTLVEAATVDGEAA